MRLGNRVGEYFEVMRRLRLGCAMFPWIFNIFLDRVERQVNERATRRGMKVRDENRGCWVVKQILYAYYIYYYLQHNVNEFERAYGKSKVLGVKNGQRVVRRRR